MMRHWVNFAAMGNPNGDGTAHWPMYEGPGSQVMRYAGHAHAAPESVTARHALIESMRVDGVLPMRWRSVEARMSARLARFIYRLAFLTIYARRFLGRLGLKGGI